MAIRPIVAANNKSIPRKAFLMKKLILLLIACAIVQGSVKAVFPAIVLAARDGDANRVEALLLSGVDPDQRGGAFRTITAMQIAAARGDQRIVWHLIDYGADVNLTLDSTPLLQAIQNGHIEIVKILISAGADVNRQTGDCATPLRYAIANHQLEIFKTLIAAGANVNQKSAYDILNGSWTLMDNATLYGGQEFVDVINRVNAAPTVAKNQILALACAGHPRLGAALPSLQSIFHGNSEVARIAAPFIRQAAFEDALYGHNQ